MKTRHAVLLLVLGALAAAPGTAGAETRTVTWSPSTAYTDGTPFEAGKTVTYDVFWTVDPTLSAASLKTIATAVPQTSATFDPGSLGMPRGQVVYVTADAVLSSGEKSVLAAPFAWNVPTPAALSISGPSSVNEGNSATYTATVTWSDNTTSPVTPAWSENSTYASISAGGVLTASSVPSSQAVTVSASYTGGTVTRTASAPVTIVDIPATLSSLSISGPSSVNEGGSATYTATATWSDGTSSPVTAAWAENSTYASISAGGVLTATTVTGNQPVTVSASYTSGTATRTASASVTIVDVPPTLSSLSVSGPSSVNEGNSATYAATATWSDGTTSPVAPGWSENSTYASISAGGVLTATTVTGNQPVTVSASYTYGAATRTASAPVTIVDVPATSPAAPANVDVSGPVAMSPSKLFRVKWDAVTSFADGTPISSGSVTYTAYWTTDPGLSAGTLRALASAGSATSVDFDPAAEGMKRNERVYLTAKAVHSSGQQSGLAAAVPWKASNIGPGPPGNGRVLKK